MGRRGRRRGSQGRAEGRVRERVRGGTKRGGTRRGGGRTGRSRGAFDVGDIERYANRLRDQVGDSPRPRGGTSGLGGVASGLAGAASGLAGGSFARRIAGSDTEGSEEDFRKEVREHLALVDERLQRLEDEVRQLRGDPADVAEPESDQ